MILTSAMPIEEKMDELEDVPDEDLAVLLGEFKADEDYEVCHAIQVILDERKSDKNSN